jgi:hypothetical protein
MVGTEHLARIRETLTDCTQEILKEFECEDDLEGFGFIAKIRATILD